ncbi:MAG: alpha/beta fold hydrolase [Vampirovibrionales bacterium]|nr:alpha/beta fold hydrolase [Vampirovibrionales bacterium]
MLQNAPFYWQSTQRPKEACLLLHGLGGGVYEMQWLASQMHEAGFTVRGINYPGHDRPSFRMPISAWQDWYGHISETYEALIANYERVSLIGFSTGCPLALKLAHEHNERHYVDKLVLLSPFINIKRSWYSRIVDVERLIPRICRVLPHVPRVGGPPINDREMICYAKTAAYYRTFNLSAVNSALQLIADIKPHLANIQNPSLVMMSHRDRVVDPSGAQYLYEHLGSDLKEMIWLQNSNHVVMLDSERQLVFDSVIRFLGHQSAVAMAAAPGGKAF